MRRLAINKPTVFFPITGSPPHQSFRKDPGRLYECESDPGIELTCFARGLLGPGDGEYSHYRMGTGPEGGALAFRFARSASIRSYGEELELGIGSSVTPAKNKCPSSAPSSALERRSYFPASWFA